MRETLRKGKFWWDNNLDFLNILLSKGFCCAFCNVKEWNSIKRDYPPFTRKINKSAQKLYDLVIDAAVSMPIQLKAKEYKENSSISVHCAEPGTTASYIHRSLLSVSNRLPFLFSKASTLVYVRTPSEDTIGSRNRIFRQNTWLR